MRIFISVSLLFVFASLGLAQTTSQNICVAEICGEPSYSSESLTLQRRTSISTTTAWRRRFMTTNAQRLSHGLPPLPPTRRAESCLVDPTANSPQASTLPQTTYEGIIELRRVSDDASMGYVSSVGRASGVFQMTTITDFALKVSFTLAAGETSGTTIPLTMTNSDGPLFGLIRGRDSTSSNIDDTFNYLYFNGISLPGTGPGCPPTTVTTSYTTSPKRDAESSIWNIDLATGLLAPQWINTDNSSPNVLTWLQSNYLFAGSNVAAFQTKFPSPLTVFKFHFIRI